MTKPKKSEKPKPKQKSKKKPPPDLEERSFDEIVGALLKVPKRSPKGAKVESSISENRPPVE